MSYSMPRTIDARTDHVLLQPYMLVESHAKAGIAFAWLHAILCCIEQAVKAIRDTARQSRDHLNISTIILSLR